ncbi:hypothetical protein [Hymenobacter cellulosilyticus]|uniref:DUF1449 family protein n=1 Tax=Hymenobacter cellulosilyticus TaxID=2932248 RepID=A0A8T9Q8Z3_9BACT|nr:hypothetical protein [Hymenobacter cellulosilyticus]UOQ71453.1 hypothetical protein MUN79_22990 [Hymenobacter cellulosilyticus]
MTELLQAAVSPPNLPATGFLIFVLLYWLTVIIGVLDFKTLDLHGTHDLPHDADLSVSWLNNALAFFNLGRVPLMVFLSFVALPLWVGSILVNYYTHNTSWLLGIVFCLPLFIGSLLVAKVLTTPFVHLFATFEKDQAGGSNPIGKVCTVLLPASQSHLGQAMVRTNGDTLVLNVKAASATELHKGDTALVIDYSASSRCYLIEPYDVR